MLLSKRHIAKVESFFDRMAEHMDSDHLQMSRSMALELETFLKFLNLSPSSKLLDLGCGTGRYVLPLLKLGYEVTGVDISRKSLQILWNQAEKGGLTQNLVLIESDFTEKIFENTFDGAYCVSTFHLLGETRAERERIFINLVSSLKRGGTLLIIQPNPFNLFFYPYYTLCTGVCWNIEKNILKCTLGYLHDLFQRVGLRNIKTRRYGMLPARWANTFPVIGEFNEKICAIPTLRRLSLFYLVKGTKI